MRQPHFKDYFLMDIIKDDMIRRCFFSFVDYNKLLPIRKKHKELKYKNGKIFYKKAIIMSEVELKKVLDFAENLGIRKNSLSLKKALDCVNDFLKELR